MGCRSKFDPTVCVDAALCRAVAFNWLILGTDAHAKNYSLLLSGQQVRFAPLYDIASTLPYGDHPRKLRLAQGIAGEYRPVYIDARRWDRLAQAVRIDAEKLRHLISEMIDQIPDALSDAIREIKLVLDDNEMVAKLRSRTTEWLASCRTAMR